MSGRWDITQHTLGITLRRHIPGGAAATVCEMPADVAAQIVADHSAAERLATACAALEAQRDAELAATNAVTPYSALHRYHQGRAEAFSSVLAALAPVAEGRGRENE